MPLTRRGLAALGAAAAIVVTAVGCATGTNELHQTNVPAPGFFPLQPVSEEGGHIAALYPIIFWIAVAVFVLVEGLLLWIVFRYRRSRHDEALPAQTHGNNLLEVLWTAIPALIVTAMFVLTVQTLGQVDAVAANEPDVVVDVQAFQWQWTFKYPKQGDLSFTGSGAEGPVMVLPIGEKVRIRLHSDDVIHSFYVPAFLYKKDVVPGRVNEFDVQVNQAGIYSGQCAEFCGLEHARMLFTVEAMSRADFDAWVIAAQQAASETPSPAPSGAPTVEVSSISITAGFDQQQLSVAADTPWTVHLTNADPSVPHNFSIRGANADGSDWIGQPNAEGGQSATYQPPPLAAGDYEFYCSLHPTTMTGTLHVGQ